MTSERIVHIVDDEAGVRKSTSILLRTSGYTTEQYESGEAFLAAADTAVMGPVLLDVRMPGLDGLQVQQLMAERKLDMPVIVLTGHGDIATAVKAIRAGALEFLEKPYDEKSLLAVVAFAFEKIDLTRARRAPEDELDISLIGTLSRREKMVLVGLMEGKQNKNIAYDLGLSPRTVEMYRARMMDKLSARSLSDALRLALEARRQRQL